MIAEGASHMSFPVAKFKNNDLAAHSVLAHLDQYRPVPEQFCAPVQSIFT